MKLKSRFFALAPLGLILLLAGCAGPSGPQPSTDAPPAPSVQAGVQPSTAAQDRVIAAPATGTPSLSSSAASGPSVVRVPGGLVAEPYSDLWGRMRAGFSMPELDTPLVAEKERFYLSNREALNRMFTRGGRYLYYIVEEVERRGMPTELALLPFVESAMNPVALSSAKAAGLWQFIPSTGKQYELSQNWWVDNRRDVVQSTRAALDYLQKIYEMNERDWFLALASYNWGENAVARAVKNNRARGLPVDYLSLSMPAETRHYVPKLIALKHIVMRASEYGIALPNVPNQPYFVTIEKTRPIDLKLAAQFAGMNVDEFVALNPAHNRPVIAASRNNQIKLPADRVDGFMASVARHDLDAQPLASWQPYTLRPGETLDDVARNGNVSTQELIRANGLRAGARIMPGTQMIAPQLSVRDELQVESFQGPRVYEQITLAPVYHRVMKRETLAGIAGSYGISADTLRAWNGGVKSVRPGTSLLVRPASNQTILTTAGGERQVVGRSEAAAAPAARVEPVALVASAAALGGVAAASAASSSGASAQSSRAAAPTAGAGTRSAAHDSPNTRSAGTSTKAAQGKGRPVEAHASQANAGRAGKSATVTPATKAGKGSAGTAAQPMTAVLKPSGKTPAQKPTAPAKSATRSTRA